MRDEVSLDAGEAEAGAHYPAPLVLYDIVGEEQGRAVNHEDAIVGSSDLVRVDLAVA